MENRRLLARLFLSVAIVAFIGLVIFFFLFLFFQDKFTREILLLFGSILLIIGIIAFFNSRSYSKEGEQDDK